MKAEVNLTKPELFNCLEKLMGGNDLFIESARRHDIDGDYTEKYLIVKMSKFGYRLSWLHNRMYNEIERKFKQAFKGEL